MNTVSTSTSPKRANDGGKPIVGLETLLEQLGYLASVGDNQTLMLESTLDELPDIQQGFDAVMTAWQNGDEATLINLLREEMAPPSCKPGWNRPCWRERNRNWVKKWPSLPNESFIVVGALHLYGEHGLLALLEQQGWRITPSPNRPWRKQNSVQSGDLTRRMRVGSQNLLPIK